MTVTQTAKVIASTRRRPASIAALVMLLLTASAVGGRAAEPITPESLSRQAVGVIGSGDKLSLKLEGGQSLAVGEAYTDGWILSGLTPSTATLTRNGQSRSIGLNPTGAPATALAADQTPTTVAVIDPQISAILKSEEDAIACRADYASQGGPPIDSEAHLAAATAQFGAAMISTCFNGGAARIQALRALSDSQRRSYYLAKGDTNAVRSMDKLPPIGPDSIPVPEEMGVDQAAQLVGLKSAAGYATGIPPQTQSIMYKCHTPQTPALVEAMKC